MPKLRSLVVTATQKCVDHEFNQDSCDKLEMEGCRLVVVADGVSSSPHGDFAALSVVQAVKERVSRDWTTRGKINEETFVKACEKASKQIDEFRREHNLCRSPASTVLIAVEMEDRLLIGYAGDGGIILTSGKTQHVGNILIPHIEGNTLTSTISANSKPAGLATLNIGRSLDDGEIVLLGTDGVFENGQVEEGYYIATDLHRACVTSPDTFDEAWIENYLRERLKTHAKEDDATLGVIITGRALGFWYRNAEKVAAEKEHRKTAQG